MMSGYGIPYEVRIHYNYGYAIALRNKVRLIDIRTPRIDGIEQKLKAAADDIRVWMMLCGVEPYMKIRHSLFADSRITAWCLIS